MKEKLEVVVDEILKALTHAHELSNRIYLRLITQCVYDRRHVVHDIKDGICDVVGKRDCLFAC